MKDKKDGIAGIKQKTITLYGTEACNSLFTKRIENVDI
jgi:hypothetical protein